MSAISSQLDQALVAANQAFKEEEYTVKCTENKDPKSPVFLSLAYKDGATTKIGIIHLVRLNDGKPNWDSRPYEEVARTTDEVTQAILARVKLFFDALKNGLYISVSGTIFDFSEVSFVINEDKTFFVGNKVITHQGTPLHLDRIQSEGIIKPIKTSNNDIELHDNYDRRPGKGIYIDQDGKIYRK